MRAVIVVFALLVVCGSAFKEPAITVLQPQSPQSGDATKGETVMVPGTAAAAPEAPALTTNTQIATSADGKPLYQVIMETPTAPCACAANVVPCGCASVRSNEASIIIDKPATTPNTAPAELLIVPQKASLIETEPGVTLLSPVTGNTPASAQQGQVVLANPNNVQITRANEPPQAVTSAIQNNSSAPVATSADGKPLYAVKLETTSTPCACQINMVVPASCKSTCASFFEAKSFARVLRQSLKKKNVPAAPAAAAPVAASAASVVSDALKAAGIPEAKSETDPVALATSAVAAGSPASAGGASAITEQTTTQTSSSAGGSSSSSGSASASKCADTMVVIHNTNLVQTVNQGESCRAPPASQPADMATAAANAPAAAAAAPAASAPAAAASGASAAAPATAAPAVAAPAAVAAAPAAAAPAAAAPAASAPASP